MAASIGAPRVLLRRLREIMAQQDTPQNLLDKIVVQVAAIMVAEVSSIYLRRQDGSLELFATEGLNPESVHTTHLKRGEGLVGHIAERAEPINLANAQSHPAFSYRPETKEDPFHAFLGVPILRAGHTLGVLTVQNQTQRHYTEEEVEALQTTAMLLAELIASGNFEGISASAIALDRTGSFRVKGLPLSEGIALGHVVLHEPRIIVQKLIAEDIGAEQKRIHEAVEKLRNTIDDLLSRGDVARAGEHRDVLEAYRMFAHDQGWLGRLEEAVVTGLTAEAAVERVQNDTRARMLRQTDPYLRERLHDLDDLSNRLLRILAGRTMTAATEDLPEDTILIARNMGAAELLDYDRQRLRGLVLEEGATASHVSIVARALGIPAVGQAKPILDHADSGDPAVVDSDSGEIYVRPTAEVVESYSDKARFRAKRQQRYAKLKDVPARTKDGEQVSILINAGLLVDLPHLSESGADGVGLFRTELQFMISSTFPRLEQQTETYKAILNAVGDKPVVFRTLDIGGDKMLPYLRHTQEENPALGWRAMRMALDRPGLFRTQIRALLRASANRRLRVMLPMVADVSEYEAARALIEKEIEHLRRHNYQGPSSVLIGAMIEVPAILWQLDRLFQHVDFVSVGSNDLMQFLFAADRSNVRVADRFDSLSPSMLRALRHIVVHASKHNVSLTLCGEMASHPIEAMALIGLGFRSISMAPASVGPIKEMILSLKVSDLEPLLLSSIDEQQSTLRPKLEQFAKEHNVPV